MTEEEKKWHNHNGVEFRFVSVSPYMYSTIESHIKAELIKSQPIAPIVRQGSIERQNEADGPYQDKMKIWNRHKALVEEISNADIAIMAGIVLKEQIPSISTWLPDVEFQLDMVGISVEDVLLPVSFMPKDKQYTYLYKKYVLLNDDTIVNLFTIFHNKDSESVMSSLEKAVQMFRAAKEREATTQSKVE